MSKKKLTDMLNRLHPISNELRLHLEEEEETLRKQDLKKHEMLFRPFGKADEAHYILTGLCKVYWKNSDNDEMIIGFFGEDEIALLSEEFVMQIQNQDMYMEAMRETVVYTITKEQMVKIYERFSEAIVLTDIIINNIHQKRKQQLWILLQPEGSRYEWFCSWFTALRMELSDKDIASFLGVSKATLCRSKKNLLFKKWKGKK
jgi:CRP-like cAMP-binding protein